MTLRKKQSAFCKALAQLILYAFEMGWELTFGDAYRDPRVHGALGVKVGYSHPKSTHKLRLAVDLNLFVRDKLITAKCREYDMLHEKWESLGGSKEVANDANHFSFEHEGVR